MKNTEIGFKHTYTTNNGYADYIVTEEVIGVFYKVGLGATTYSNTSWNDVNSVKGELDKFYQVLHQSKSKHTLNIDIITYSEQELFEQFRKK
jgi:hypothetical protein